MHTETKNKRGTFRNLVILAIFLLAFLIYYMVMAMLAPGKRRVAINEEYGFMQGERNDIDESIYEDSTFLNLSKQRSFLQARIMMVESDSVFLTMNLSDSTIHLEINGVSVHSTRIKKLNMSKIIRNGKNYVIASMLARPFTVEKNYSSIEKEPLMIKMAPKDTSEYQPDIIPDTADVEPVFFIMEMDNDTRFIVYQEEKINPGDGLRLLVFDMSYRIRNTVQALKDVILLRIPDYNPYIKIRIPRSDAKIIFRALPEHGQIGVYI